MQRGKRPNQRMPVSCGMSPRTALPVEPNASLCASKLYGEPLQTPTRGHGYLSEAAKNATRIPTGHPEGYLEAFATIYIGIARGIHAQFDSKPLKTAEYDFPTVYDGLRG